MLLFFAYWETGSFKAGNKLSLCAVSMRDVPMWPPIDHISYCTVDASRILRSPLILRIKYSNLCEFFHFRSAFQFNYSPFFFMCIRHIWNIRFIWNRVLFTYFSFLDFNRFTWIIRHKCNRDNLQAMSILSCGMSKTNFAFRIWQIVNTCICI